MSFYILLYAVVIFALLYTIFISYQKYIKLFFWRYLIVWLWAFSIWLIIYLLAFITTANPDIILVFSIALYALAFIAIYSILLFFLFYWKRHSNTLFIKNINFIIFFFLIGILCTSLFSEFFIESLVYKNSLYYEEFGPWFPFVQISYFLNPFLLVAIIFYRYRKLSWINRIRYKYIALWYSFFLFNYVFFLAVLPSFDIWLLQKEQILFFVPFVAALLYSSYRYKFTPLSIELRKICIYIFSLALAVFLILFLKKYLSLIDYRLIGFWWIKEGYSAIDIVLWIIFFYWINKYLLQKFITYKTLENLRSTIFNFWEKISFIQTFTKLNLLLTKEFKSRVGISDAYIIPKTDLLENHAEIMRFFSQERQHEFLLNDYVFIEENRNKFDKETISSEMDKKIWIYFPLYSKNNEIEGVFCIGKKPFGDFYTSEEIDVFRDFSRFLQWHLKYISIYSQIHDLNVNLDKKVDEKTLEYNTLINRQKEFIAFISHEIKNPVTNTIFLVDTIKTEVKEYVSKTKDRNVLDDIDILNKELTRISDLTKTIFSVEKHDLHGIKLFKEFVSLYDFLQEHVRSFENQHTNIVFETTMEDVWNIEIDKVQFGQVIDNLIGNATKFVGDNKWKICISMTRSENKKIEIIVEDNGKWFENIDIDTLFDKYSIGESNSTGLGMGLYLCKRIVELHGGSITPSYSSKLGGAKFTIVL